jgi:hypothetical protein
MTCRNSRGRFDRPEITAPLIVRKAKTARSEGVARGNRTRASMRRRAALAMFGVYL